MDKPISITDVTVDKSKKPPSVMWKVLLISILCLVLLIPLAMIQNIISERKGTKETVVNEIANSWAGEQILTGPILVVPYKVWVSSEKGDYLSERLSYLLPDQYDLNSSLAPQTRYRGIYQSVVYTSQINAKGYFNLSKLNELGIDHSTFLWNKAYVILGIESTNGIAQNPVLHLKGKPLELLPGVNGNGVLTHGLYTNTPLSPQEVKIPFEFSLNLKGSQSLSITPVGKQSNITMASNWRSPSFTGSNLPAKRDVTNQGFTATWNIPYFTRSYGQVFKSGCCVTEDSLKNSAVGTELLTPVDSYKQSERAVKYGILFLSLTFTTYFLFEVISRCRIHAFQYFLVGLSLCLFYLLLIATSEVIPFHWAYCIGSISTILTISLYTKGILKRGQYIIGSLLSLLYGYLYVLLQLEELSLLFGAIGLFCILAVIMFITRKIDWYNEKAV